MRVGIDIGGMSIKIGLVNEEAVIADRAVLPTDLTIPTRELIVRLAGEVGRLLEKNGLSVSECENIGIGCPGTVERRTGEILYSNNVGWENIPMAAWLEEEWKKTPAIANDADAAALGEVYGGAAKGASNAVLLTLGTGVGGGVILNRKVFSGAVRGGSELGHMVLQKGGKLCTCGRRGCMEAYVSASALMESAREAAKANQDSLLFQMCRGDLGKMDGKIPFDAAKKEDATAMAVVSEYLEYLACGIANVINIFRPEIVILGGGVSAQKENLTRPLQEMVDKACFGGEHGRVAKIVTSQLGNDAGIIGAAYIEKV